MQIVIEPLDHTSESVAKRIHAVQMAAYAQEAELIGAVDFPPLKRMLEDLRSSAAQFFGAFLDGELAGAAAIESGGAGQLGISSFVVAPSVQRRGIGRALLAHLIERHGHQEPQVQTAVRNAPALALYRSGGFTEVRRWFVGVEGLELVELRRPRSGPDKVA